MFESLIKSKLKSTIKEKMKDNKLILSEKELIQLINYYTDNEFKINLGIKSGEKTNEYYDTELTLELK